MPQNSAIPPKSIAERHLSFTAHGGTGNTYVATVSNPTTSANATTAPLQCRYISIANIADLTSPGTVDGGTLVTGDVVCLTSQTTASENGIYVTNSSGELERSGVALTPLALINVVQGTKWAGTQWKITNAETFVVGTDDITIAPNGIVKAGISGSYNSGRLNITASTGISLSPSGLDAFSNQVQISNSGVTSLTGETGGIGVSAGTGAVTITNLGVKKITADSTDLTGNITLTSSDMSVGIDVTGSTIDLTASASGGGTVDTQDFVSSGTWTKPANAKRVELYCVGAGGGGGSGARGAAGNNHSGGGGGGAGQLIIAALLASDCSSTETVTIGGGGTGGAAKTANGAGNDGSVGGDTSFGTLVVAKGGNGGFGGIISGVTAANGGTRITNYNRFSAQDQVSGGASATNSGNAVTPSDHVFMTNRGGGGGTISSTGTDRLPAAGGAVVSPSGASICAGGSAGGSTGASGGGGNFSNVYLVGSGGGGGYCGDSGGTVAGGAGGAGGGYGAGGGGGGSSITGANSGAGGDGAGGFLRVVTYCGV